MKSFVWFLFFVFLKNCKEFLRMAVLRNLDNGTTVQMTQICCSRQGRTFLQPMNDPVKSISEFVHGVTGWRHLLGENSIVVRSCTRRNSLTDDLWIASVHIYNCDSLLALLCFDETGSASARRPNNEEF